DASQRCPRRKSSLHGKSEQPGDAVIARLTRKVERVNVAIVGAGYFGRGLLRRLALLDDFAPRLVANRTPDKAIAAYKHAGVAHDRIVLVDNARQAQQALNSDLYVVTADLLLAAELNGI